MRLRPLLVLAVPLIILPVAGEASTPWHGVPRHFVATPVVAQSLHHTITLKALGLPQGVQLDGFGRTRDFFFTVPASVDLASSQLDLVYDVTASQTGRRVIEVAVNDKVVATSAIKEADGPQRLTIALPPRQPGEGVIKVSIRYKGEIDDDRCLEDRIGGETLNLRPESGLELAFHPSGLASLDAVLALMPDQVVIGLPDRSLDGAQVANALEAFRLFRALGHQVTIRPVAQNGLPATPAGLAGNVDGPWSTGIVVVSGGQVQGNPISFGAQGPVVQITPQQLELLSARRASTAHAPALPLPLGGHGTVRHFLPFERLGHAPALTGLVAKAEFALPFTMTELPAHSRPAAIAVDLLAAPDSDNRTVVASIFVNDELIGSERLQTSKPQHIELPVARRLLGLANTVRVVVQREPAEGGCKHLPLDYPVQLLASSGLLLQDAPDAHAFHEWAAYLREGVDVRLDTASAAEQRRAIELVGTMLASLTGLDAPISAPGGSAAHPLVYYGKDKPANLTFPLRFDEGRTVLHVGDQDTLFDSGNAHDMLAVQLAAGDHGSAGLWVKPFGDVTAMALPDGIFLDRGDVAIVGEAGNVSYADTHESDVIADYPDEWSVWAFATRYEVELVAGAWVLLTLGFLYALRKVRRKHRSDGEDS